MNVEELNKYLRAKLLAKNIAKFYQKDTLKFYKKLQNSTKKLHKFYQKQSKIVPGMSSSARNWLTAES